MVQRVGNTGPRLNSRAAQANAERQEQERRQALLSQRGETQQKIDQTKGTTYTTWETDPNTGVRTPTTVNNMKTVGTMGPQTITPSPYNNYDMSGVRALNDLASPITPQSTTTDNAGVYKKTFSSSSTQAPGSSIPRSSAGQQILQNVEQRRQERLSRGDPNARRETSIVQQQREDFLNQIQQESQTDDYKQRAFAELGFKNDGTDFDNLDDPNIKMIFDEGGYYKALDYIDEVISKKIGWGPGIEIQKQKMIADLNRIQDSQDINDGTYIFEGDRKTIQELEDEQSQLEQEFKQQSDYLQEGVQQQRSMNLTEFEAAMSQLPAQLEEFKNMDPEVYGIYEPLILQAQQAMFDLESKRYELENAAYDNTDEIAAFEGQIDEAYFDRLEQKSLNKDATDLLLQVAKDAKQAKEVELEIKKIEDAAAIFDKEQEILKEEASNRRIAARFGLDTDTNGLKDLSEEYSRGRNELRDMKKIANLENYNIVSNIASEYSRSVDTALLQYRSQDLLIDQNYRNFKFDTTQAINLSKKEEAEAKQDRIISYWDQKKTNREALSSAISSLNADLRQSRIDEDTRSMQKQEALFSRFITAVNTYGSSNPGLLGAIKRDMAKAGIDVSGIDVNAQTFDEMEAIKSAQVALDGTIGERLTRDFSSLASSVPFDEGIAYLNIRAGDATADIKQGLHESLARVAILPNTDSLKKSTVIHAATTALPKEQEQFVRNNSATVPIISQAMDDLEALVNTSYWTAVVNGKKKFVDIKNETEFKNLNATLSQMSAQEATDIFGANFTESEQTRAEQFLLINGLQGNKQDILNIGRTWVENRNKTANSYIRGVLGPTKFADEIIGQDSIFNILAGAGGSNSSYDIDAVFNMEGAFSGEGAFSAPANMTPANMTPANITPAGPTNIDAYNRGEYVLPPVRKISYTPITDVPVQITAYGSSLNDAGVDIWPTTGKGTPFKTPVRAKVKKVRGGYSNPRNTPDPKYTASNPSWGNYIQLEDDNGYVMQYAHLDKINLKEGDYVEPGSLIGLIGNTGSTMGNTGVHIDATLYAPDGRTLSAREAAAYLSLRA